ncbi:MAG: inositol monophosphatase family protein [Thermodesulfovibrionales bacterium]|jgi:myo-inositol-1(or 4)-monophosphatase
MDISDLRGIGKTLFSETGRIRLRPDSSEPLGKGAAGDATFPIDRRAEEIILSGLEAMDEPLSIISEECGVKELKGGGLRVLIDPIDGSKNAVTGIPFYCTSIAVAEGSTIGSISMAYVLNLLTGDEFWAEKGKGAFFNGQRICSQQADDTFYLVAYEMPNTGKDFPRIAGLLSQARRTRCFGSTALDLSYVAYGAVSVFVTPSPSRSFDYGGGGSW